MDLNLLFWLVIAGIVVAWLAHSVPEPAEALGGIFGFREALWPSGVQEDDDAHWSWARALRDRAPAQAPKVVDAVDVIESARPSDDVPGTLPGVTGGRYEVRAAVRAQVRSADRARS